METKKIKITLDESEFQWLAGEGYEVNGLTTFFCFERENIFWTRKIVEALGYEIISSKKIDSTIYVNKYEVSTNMPFEVYLESL